MPADRRSLLGRGAGAEPAVRRVRNARQGSDFASRDRLPSLTGLRFWAALLVVLYHLTRQVGELQPISALVYFGRSGVTFFFVLSGFVLAWTYLDARTPLGTFYWRRFARLWPLVAVTGGLSLVAYAAVGVEVPPLKALSTFVFLQAWRSGWVGGANPAAWSLSDEVFFYLLFPALLTLAQRPHRRVILWCCVVASIPLLFLLALSGGWLDARFDYFPPSRLPQFVLGVLCGVAVREGRRVPLSIPAVTVLVLAYHGVLYGLLLALGQPRWLYSGSQWWSAVPFAVLIVAAAQTDLAGRRSVFSGPWSRRLGHWSFGWYLVHEIVIRVVDHRLREPEGSFDVLLRWIIVLLVSLTVAGVLYSAVERPLERWLRSHQPVRTSRTRASSQRGVGA